MSLGDPTVNDDGNRQIYGLGMVIQLQCHGMLVPKYTSDIPSQVLSGEGHKACKATSSIKLILKYTNRDDWTNEKGGCVWFMSNLSYISKVQMGLSPSQNEESKVVGDNSWGCGVDVCTVVFVSLRVGMGQRGWKWSMQWFVIALLYQDLSYSNEPFDCLHTDNKVAEQVLSVIASPLPHNTRLMTIFQQWLSF